MSFKERRGAEYIIKKMGPRAEPCGTPEKTSAGLELWPLITVTV